MEFEIDSFEIELKSYSRNNVPVVNRTISYNGFFTSFMCCNIPCVIEGVAENWEACLKWLNKDKSVNLAYLKRKYGSCDVTVYDCNQRYYNSQQTQCCKLGTFLDQHWASRSELKYLKDWHLKNTHKSDDFYEVPLHFASDWLNEYLTEKNEDDYRFVYMGQAHTWTPFHADVFNSFSWSANICGQKRWILLPPGEENKLRDPFNNLPYDITACYKNADYVEVIQEAGEAIFVPSGWHHQVWNLQDTISVNHNWVNGCNIGAMWGAMQESLTAVKHEISDCGDMDDFLQHCQVMLKASFGMDFYKFYEFLEFIAEQRILVVEKQLRKKLFHGHFLGVEHARFDLKAVMSVLEKLLKHRDAAELFTYQLDTGKNLCKTINSIINI